MIGLRIDHVEYYNYPMCSYVNRGQSIRLPCKQSQRIDADRVIKQQKHAILLSKPVQSKQAFAQNNSTHPSSSSPSPPLK